MPTITKPAARTAAREEEDGVGPVIRSDRVRRQIADQIISGALRPGQELDEKKLAEAFSVSRTPVREALRQLAAASLVEWRPHQSAVVAKITPSKMVEMFEVMAELEAMCARLAARRMSEAERHALVRAHAACEAARDSEDPDPFYYQNEAFHHVIYAGSHNSFLAERASALNRRLRPYRRLQLRIRGVVASSFAEHQKVTTAILAGDAALAAECLRKHVIVQGERFADLVALLKPAVAANGAPGAALPQAW